LRDACKQTNKLFWRVQFFTIMTMQIFFSIHLLFVDLRPFCGSKNNSLMKEAIAKKRKGCVIYILMFREDQGPKIAKGPKGNGQREPRTQGSQKSAVHNSLMKEAIARKRKGCVTYILMFREGQGPKRQRDQ
jgi:hypothetical protein